MDYVRSILASPAVWAAVIVILRLIVQYLAIPNDLSNAVMVLIVAILAAVGVGDVRLDAARRIETRQMQARRIGDAK